MPASRSAEVKPSDTSLVMKALQDSDDFMSITQLVGATKLKRRQIMRALWYLQKVHAVESVTSQGSLYWFHSEATDTRKKVIEERRKEDEPRRFNGRRAAVKRKVLPVLRDV